jgi:hypothetical protein
MPSSQSHASAVMDSPMIEEIKTTLYVDSARLKVLSQETTLHAADTDKPVEQATQGCRR